MAAQASPCRLTQEVWEGLSGPNKLYRQMGCAVGVRDTTFTQASLGHGQGDLISKYRLQPSLEW